MRFLFIASLLMGWSALVTNDISITLNPATPVVITGDFTNGNKRIAGPWFQFRPTITNNSQQPITIVGLRLDINFLRPGNIDNRSPSTVTYTVSPSEFNYTMNCSRGTKHLIQFDSLGMIMPGETKTLNLHYTGDLPPPIRPFTRPICPA